ncbi:putative allergen Asp f 4 [Halenospora varia]|nr:putative allergen Asp f 4 [Halenospora varia]
MRTSAASGLMLAALIGNAVAGPTHMHLHQKVHEKKDVQERDIDWNNLGIDWSSAWAEGQKTKTAAPAVATSAAAKATGAVFAEAKKSSATATATSAKATSTSSSGSNSGLWKGIKGVSNDRTSFGSTSGTSVGSEVSYVGNYGSPYGSNIIKVDSVGSNKYTNTFTNSQSSTITVNIWNKVGSDLLANSGQALAPKDTTLTFTLAPGASQVVAFAENTQIGWAQACDNIAASGAFATTWGEANFVSTGCGYDVSAIMNSAGNTYNMSISSTEAPQCTSDMTQNFWLNDKTPVGTSDGSCYISAGTCTMKTVMGGNV